MRLEEQWDLVFYTGLIGLLFWILVGVVGYSIWKQGKKALNTIVAMSGLFVGAMIAWALLMPQNFSWIWYQGVYAHSATLIFVAIGVASIGLSVRYYRSREYNLFGMWVTYAVLFIFGGVVFVAEATKARMAELTPFELMEEPYSIESRLVPWAPRLVAGQMMFDQFNESRHEVSLDYTRAIPWDDGLAYTTFVHPDGINAFLVNGEGNFVYHDAPGVDPEQLVDFIEEEQYVGMDQEWTTNIWWQLYHRDLTAYYPDYYPIWVTETRPDGTKYKHLLHVAPKIEYQFEWKWGVPVFIPQVTELTTVEFDHEEKRAVFADIPFEEASRASRSFPSGWRESG